MKLKRQEVYLPRQTSGADPFSFQATFFKTFLNFSAYGSRGNEGSSSTTLRRKFLWATNDLSLNNTFYVRPIDLRSMD